MTKKKLHSWDHETDPNELAAADVLWTARHIFENPDTEYTEAYRSRARVTATATLAVSKEDELERRLKEELCG